MYKVIFKGQGLEPLFLDDEKGKKVQDVWLQNTNTRIVTGDTAFATGDIKQITKETERVETKHNAARAQDVDKEYRRFREQMLALPIEKRANILRIPKLLYKAHTNNEMPDDVKQEIITRQLTYFQSHPNCIYANPSCYSDLIPKLERKKEKDKANPIQNTLPLVVLRFVEEAIRTDLHYGRA